MLLNLWNHAELGVANLVVSLRNDGGYTDADKNIINVILEKSANYSATGQSMHTFNIDIHSGQRPHFRGITSQ